MATGWCEKGTVHFQKVLYKEWGASVACETLDYKIILASNSLAKTLRFWRPKGWSQRLNILSSFRGTGMGFALFLFLSQSMISPKTSLAASSCQECSERTLSLPLRPENRGPVRKHVRLLGCGKHRRGTLFPNLCRWNNWKPHSRASLFIFCSAKISETQNKSEARGHWIMSAQRLNAEESLDLF